ncbi:MAG: twin-arginine translocase TatA/TatE family subunit [Chloroflexi bacterium]|nr:twin-arginine translocase TatA/TatE family subunit [Chloroflexota bacterium]
MFGVGPEEIVVILFVALLVLGPERMPKLARDLGKLVNDLRKSSDQLREEFLNSDKLLDKVAALPEGTEATATSEPAPAPTAGAAVAEPAPADVTGAVVEEETASDREAREARARLTDPERAKTAAAEGWTVPKDEAGTSDRWG